MTIKEYLKQSHTEAMPQWLADYTPGCALPLREFLGSRMVYYPGCGSDGHAVKVFGGSHSAHCFIMVDYMRTEKGVKRELVTAGFTGYSVLDERSIAKQEMFAAVSFAPHLTDAELQRAANATEGKPSRAYAFLTILERKPEFGEDHGPVRLAILFMYADAIAAYDAFFGNKNVPNFFGMLLQDHGFGGNYDSFGREGLMAKIAERTSARPEMILCEDYDYMWPGYEKIDAEPSRGGMHGNVRCLWRDRTDETTSEELPKDNRFRDWDANYWIRQFAEAEGQSARGVRDGRCSDGGFTAKELLAKCDWRKFKGVEIYDRPKLMTGCPWFLDRPECSHIKPTVEDWAQIVCGHVEFADRCPCWAMFDDSQWKFMLEYHPELAVYRSRVLRDVR